MANVGSGTSRVIIDPDGEAATVTNNRLDVNAVLSASDNIEIGNVDIKFDGTAASVNSGALTDGTLRVTLATNDTAATKINTIATMTTSLSALIQTEDSEHESGDAGYMNLGVRNDNLASLADTDGDYAPFQVNASGALYVTSGADHDDAVVANGMQIMAEAKVIDGSSLPNATAEGDAIRLAASRAGIQYTHLTNDTGTDSAILEEDSQHATGDFGIMSLAVRNNTHASLVGSDGDYAPLQVNADGALYVADDSHWGTIGEAADSNGTAHGQLRYIGSQAAQIQSFLATIDVDTGLITDLLGYPLQTLGTSTYVEGNDYGNAIAAVRNDTLAALADTDNEFAPFQVDALGALYTSSVKGSLDTFAMIDVDNSEEVLSDTIGTITDCNEIIFQADESNSGYIMIGDTDVADNRGIKLNAGDTFILEKQSTAGINLWASAADQNLRCTLMRAA